MADAERSEPLQRRTLLLDDSRYDGSSRVARVLSPLRGRPAEASSPVPGAERESRGLFEAVETRVTSTTRERSTTRQHQRGGVEERGSERMVVVGHAGSTGALRALGWAVSEAQQRSARLTAPPPSTSGAVSFAVLRCALVTPRRWVRGVRRRAQRPEAVVRALPRDDLVPLAVHPAVRTSSRGRITSGRGRPAPPAPPVLARRGRSGATGAPRPPGRAPWRPGSAPARAPRGSPRRATASCPPRRSTR